MKINIITFQPFPNGRASTNRIYLYAKGFVEKGHDCEVLVLTPTEMGEILNKTVTGSIENIRYKYLCGTTVLSKKLLKSRSLLRQVYKIKRKLLRTWAIIILGIHFLKSQNKKSAIFLYLNSVPFYFLYIKLLAKLSGSKYFLDVSEMPYIHAKTTYFFTKYFNFYMRRIYKLFDGIIVISNYLKIKFEEYGHKNTLKVPILVDVNEFLNKEPCKTDNKYIAYAGILDQKKDGIFTLIEAFALTSKKFSDLKLYIIGKTDNTIQYNIIIDKIKKMNLTDKIILPGYVTRENLIEIYRNAALLALAKERNVQNESNFPSKIAEYLAAARPVVVTKIGELEHYLSEKSVFFVDEPTAYNFSIKFNEVLTNPENSSIIAAKGHDIALREFHYRTQADKIINYFEVN